MKESASLHREPSFCGRSGSVAGRGFFYPGLWLTLFLPIFAMQAAAAAEVAVGMGGSVTFAPYKHYDTQWLPMPMVDLDSDYFYIRGTAAGVKIYKLDFLEISAFGTYDATSFNATDTSDARLRMLQGRDASVAAGMEVRLLTPYGMLHASAARDILGHSDGWNGTLGYAYSVEFGPLELIPTAGVYWTDSRYTDYYYGISDRESRNIGLTAYNPGTGKAPYLGLMLTYSLTATWDIFCNGEIVFLSDNIQDSPMVGRSQIRSLAAGIMYNF
ncbi:MAG: MipA/OmpV family protein [Desulfobulbus sp.]|nr:MipA/OmpV family protein [Desulfobulbus sp.]